MKYKVCITCENRTVIEEYFKTKKEAFTYAKYSLVYLRRIVENDLKFSIKIYNDKWVYRYE